jgi:phage-related protein
VKLLQEFSPRDLGSERFKHVEGKIWEIRLRARSGIARALYVAVRAQTLTIVRAFVKKTQKTPQRDLEIARKRAKEVR